MSPELFDPERFDLKDGRQTKRSDCYALGMVIYEVLSGRTPLFQYEGYTVVAKIINGERPRRPRGAERGQFTDDIWGTLERCWRPTPRDRPSIRLVLQQLEMASGSWTPPENMTGLPAMNPPVRNSNQSADESMEESEEYSPSQTASSQPPLRLPLKGDPNESHPFPPAHGFSAPRCGAPGCQGLGPSNVDPNGSDSEESVEIQDKVGWAIALDSLWY